MPRPLLPEQIKAGKSMKESNEYPNNKLSINDYNKGDGINFPQVCRRTGAVLWC